MSTTGERFIDENEKAIKYYRATQLTILSRVIALLNEKNLSQEITMTVKPERGGYFIEVHPIQFCEW